MASSWLLPWCARSTMSPVQRQGDDKAGKSALCQQGHQQVKVGACALARMIVPRSIAPQLAARTSCPNAVLPLRIRQGLGPPNGKREMRTQQQCTRRPPTRRAHRMCSAWPPQPAVKEGGRQQGTSASGYHRNHARDRLRSAAGKPTRCLCDSSMGVGDGTVLGEEVGPARVGGRRVFCNVSTFAAAAMQPPDHLAAPGFPKAAC